jgi:hypothetical protein
MALSQQVKDQMGREGTLREAASQVEDALVGKTIEQISENRYVGAAGDVLTKVIINARGTIANVVVDGAEFRQTNMVGKVISDVDFVFIHNDGEMSWSIKMYSGGHHSYNMVGEIWADGADPSEVVQAY